jgi:hypothetical protein
MYRLATETCSAFKHPGLLIDKGAPCGFVGTTRR